MNILGIIKQIEEEKREQNITPHNALLIPLTEKCLELGITKAQLTEELESMYRAGIIKSVSTINDSYIQVL